VLHFVGLRGLSGQEEKTGGNERARIIEVVREGVRIFGEQDGLLKR